MIEVETAAAVRARLREITGKPDHAMMNTEAFMLGYVDGLRAGLALRVIEVPRG